MTFVVIWFPVLVLALVGIIFVYRRLYRELPFFFLYVLFASLIGLVRYAASHYSKSVHFYVYWISELAGAVLVALALYEVFLRRMFIGFQRVRFYRALFPAVAAATLLLTILSAAEASDKSAAFLRASRAFDFVRTAVLVFFIALMLLMGRAWSRYDLGVTLGFGIQAAAALANAALRTRLQQRLIVFDVLEYVTYDVACVIWLITFWKPEKRTAPPTSQRVDSAIVHQARTWEAMLKNWLMPGKTKQNGAG
jgi:hypothetical protein